MSFLIIVEMQIHDRDKFVVHTQLDDVDSEFVSLPHVYAAVYS